MLLKWMKSSIQACDICVHVYLHMNECFFFITIKMSCRNAGVHTAASQTAQMEIKANMPVMLHWSVTHSLLSQSREREKQREMEK